MGAVVDISLHCENLLLPHAWPVVDAEPPEAPVAGATGPLAAIVCPESLSLMFCMPCFTLEVPLVLFCTEAWSRISFNGHTNLQCASAAARHTMLRLQLQAQVDFEYG